MTSLYIILAIGLTGLIGWGILIGFADAMLRRRHDEMLEMRRWQETVQAMRRMTDQEGDA